MQAKKDEWATTPSEKMMAATKAKMANAPGSSPLLADLEKLCTMLVRDLKSTNDKALAPLTDSVNKLRETTEPRQPDYWSRGSIVKLQ